MPSILFYQTQTNLLLRLFQKKSSAFAPFRTPFSEPL